MKKWIALIALTVSLPAVGATYSGVDTNNESCEIYMDDFGPETGADGRPAYFVNSRFADIAFNGLMVTRTEDEKFEFKAFMQNTGGQMYERVNDASARAWVGIGVLDIEGRLILRGERRAFLLKASGRGAYSWWSKAYICQIHQG